MPRIRGKILHYFKKSANFSDNFGDRRHNLEITQIAKTSLQNP